MTFCRVSISRTLQGAEAQITANVRSETGGLTENIYE